MDHRLASVYGLKDRRNDEIFYVGMSIDPYARYGQHLAFRVARDAKENRILAMRKEGLMPELVILEKDIPIKKIYDREVYWIRHYSDLGIRLTNTNGLPKEPKHEQPAKQSATWIAAHQVYKLLWPFRDGRMPDCVSNFAYQRRSIRRKRDEKGALSFHKKDVLEYREALIQKGQLPPTVREIKKSKCSNGI